MLSLEYTGGLNVGGPIGYRAPFIKVLLAKKYPIMVCCFGGRMGSGRIRHFMK